MKKRILCLLLVFGLVFCWAGPALAGYDYDLVYDDTGLLDQEDLSRLGHEVLAELSDRYRFQVRVDVVSDLEGYEIKEYAGLFYSGYEYGYAGSQEGMLLMLRLIPDGGDLSFGGFCLFQGGDGPDLTALAEENGAFSDLYSYMNEEAWSGDVLADQETGRQALAAYAEAMDALLAQAGYPETSAVAEGVTGEEGNHSQLTFLTDEAELLSPEEWLDLEEQASTLSQQYDCGLYVVTVEDFTDYSDEDVRTFAEDLYTQYDMGYGPDRDGVLLLLSMADRDYALIAHGDLANRAFTDYGKDLLSDAFLDNFADNDWYGGFQDYLTVSGEFLGQDTEGVPIDVDTDLDELDFIVDPPPPAKEGVGEDLAVGFLAGGVISLITTGGMRRKMKSVRTGARAEDYVVHDSLNLRVQDDRFAFITQTRVKIESDSHRSGGGGTHVNSGGFSGKSGKF